MVAVLRYTLESESGAVADSAIVVASVFRYANGFGAETRTDVAKKPVESSDDSSSETVS
jgi:hypothetical protein